jgi:hypothetical protein
MSAPQLLSRRTFTALSGGFAVSLASLGTLRAGAHEASPEAAAITPLGFASLRLRTLLEPEGRAEVNGLVVSELLPAVTVLPGYGGYLLADVIDVDTQSVALSVFESADQIDAFNTAASSFVESVADKVDGPATKTWTGDILMKAAPTATATPVAQPLSSGYAAVRIHTSLPDTDPRDFVPEAIAGFLPLITVLPGFLGYLWFPCEGGFAAITLYDSAESATASSEAAVAWATEHLAAYTDGKPTIINATIYYSDLPILG